MLLTDRQTDRQSNGQRWKHNLRHGGGNNNNIIDHNHNHSYNIHDKIIGSNNIDNINTQKEQLQYDSIIISKVSTVSS